MQSILSILFPAQCMGCGTLVTGDAALCPECWRDTPFIRGASCLKCGAPLVGEAPGDETAMCDDCFATPRAWESGSAVFVYQGLGRRLVMALKHGDRHDLARPMAKWMISAAQERPTADDVVVPVPIHWRRMLKRKFNQSALLSKMIAGETNAQSVPDALIRVRHTPPQENLKAAERIELQANAMRMNPARIEQIRERRVFLIDDVMTSGATLNSAAVELKTAGVRTIHTLTLARVVKDF